MTPRTVSLYTLIIAVVLALSGCKKDDFVKETLSETKSLVEAIDKEISGAKDKKAGVAAGQKLLDEKKEDLGAKLKELGGLRGFQVSEEVQAQMTTDLTTVIVDIQKLKLGVAMSGDKEAIAAVDKLIKELSDLVASSGGE